MVKVGIIGLGHMGQLHMLNAMRVDGVKIVAAADKSPKNCKFAGRFNVKTYDDYTKLIDAGKLDAVIISLQKPQKLWTNQRLNMKVFLLTTGAKIKPLN